MNKEENSKFEKFKNFFGDIGDVLIGSAIRYFDEYKHSLYNEGYNDGYKDGSDNRKKGKKKK